MQQAADLLHVSRPYLISLLEDGAIPYRGIGNHCRLQLEDVVSFKTRVDQEREVVLDELSSEAQEQGHGYYPLRMYAYPYLLTWDMRSYGLASC